jgi:hypothetical protein
MRTLMSMAAAIIAVAASGIVLNASANATVGGGLRAAIDGLNLVERAEFSFGGHKHCWYEEGWHGPGWYWCGYAHRKDHGWGGPEGFQGWKH